VNLDIEKGKIYGVVGVNGSGKSVLFKLICGFIFPDKGDVYVRDVKLGGGKNRFPENVGIIIDGSGFIPNKTGFENLKELALIRDIITDGKIKETMNMVGLDEKLKQKVKNYSLGMKQKLAIAQAIMEEQDILVLDEPFNALDEESTKTIRSLFIDLKNEGKTILITSHIKEDIQTLCDHVLKINSARLEFSK
jgi:ABC-2 type transport system ATP-binding protein